LIELSSRPKQDGLIVLRSGEIPALALALAFVFAFALALAFAFALALALAFLSVIPEGNLLFARDAPGAASLVSL
jgi:hypothetical protein